MMACCQYPSCRSFLAVVRLRRSVNVDGVVSKAKLHPVVVHNRRGEPVRVHLDILGMAEPNSASIVGRGTCGPLWRREGEAPAWGVLEWGSIGSYPLSVSCRRWSPATRKRPASASAYDARRI